MLSYEEGIVSLESKGFELIAKAEGLINKLTGDAVFEAFYESKNTRLREWSPDGGEIYELVIAIFTIALLNETNTIQSVIGLVAGKVSCDDPLDRAKCAAECIALCAHADLIDIKFSKDRYYVSTRWELDTDILRADKHITLTTQPTKKETNQLLGCRYKRHEGDTCLDHTNRMNSIKLSLNLPLIRELEEQATFIINTEQKADQWELFITNSYKKYLELARGDNEFFLEWKYDTRGRSYSEGYYLNVQGSSFKKSIVQLANKEVVQL